MANLLVNADTAPVINGTITHKSDGTPRNLTGCQVYFQLRLETDRGWRIDRLCTITNATTGSVSYDLQDSDLNFVGDCVARFLVVGGDGKRQHTVPVIPLTLEAQ